MDNVFIEWNEKTFRVYFDSALLWLQEHLVKAIKQAIINSSNLIPAE